MLSELLTAAQTGSPVQVTDVVRSEWRDNPYYDENRDPIIGIVSQPIPDRFKSDPRFEGKKSYIQQSYVHFLESAGARVAPIIPDDTDCWGLFTQMNPTHAILLPGGEGEYLETAKCVVGQVKGMNYRNPMYYPLFAIGLGFEYLLQIDSKSDLISVPVHGKSLKLEFLD